MGSHEVDNAEMYEKSGCTYNYDTECSRGSILCNKALARTKFGKGYQPKKLFLENGF